MAHGYLGHGYGTHGEIEPGSSDDHDRDSRERNWRRDEDWRARDRDRGMMFGSRDRDWSGSDDWSGRGNRHEGYWNEGYRREHGFGEFQRGNRDDEDWDRNQRGFGGSAEPSQSRRSFSAHPDDHYRSWRDRHMSELDRDYQDYCREREQQFHREFDDWRRQKYGNPQPLRTGMTQSGISHDPSGMTEAAEDRAPQTASEPDPTAEATLGTNSAGPRGRR